MTSALFSAFSDDLFGTIVLAFTVSSGAGMGKLAFDSLVQRDAPDANHGRSFARFEARFQLAFAVGAFFPVMIPLGITVGSWFVAGAAGFAAFSYLVGKPGRAGLRRRIPPVPGLGHLQRSVAGVDETTAGEEVEAAEVGAEPAEFTDEDLRASQPAPPAAVGDWNVPETWDETTPYVSSIDGVEVDPAPSVPPTPADRSDDDPAI